jgi:hypothetical protein
MSIKKKGRLVKLPGVKEDRQQGKNRRRQILGERAAKKV